MIKIKEMSCKRSQSSFRIENMDSADWEAQIESLLEDIKVIEKSKKETFENFNQFCEFIAEPAFENLMDELKKYQIKSRFKREKKRYIDFQINFQGSRIDHFHYIVRLPENSIDLKLKLQIKGRRNKNSRLESREESFMPEVKPLELLKLAKEEIIQDVIEYYRNFIYGSMAQPT